MSRVISETTLTKQRQEGLALVSPLKTKVASITIRTADDYIKADEALYQVRQAKEAWLSRINPIIESIRSGLDLLYGLRKDIVDPLDQLEGMVKDRMKAFKIEEARQLRIAEEAKAREQAELQKQIEEKEKAEAKAKTSAMANRILDSRARLEQALAESQSKPLPEAVKVIGSSTRNKKKWVVKDMQAFIKYLSDNPDLISMVQVDLVQMNALYRIDKPGLGEWMPGVMIEEDITIAGRR